jgi:Spy/CpxP family protein refolding chaperone
MKKVILSLVLVFVFGMGSVSSQMGGDDDGYGYGMHGRRGEGLLLEIKKDLNLSDEQFNKIKDCRNSVRKERKEFREERRKIRDSIRSEIEKEKTDMKKIDKLIEESVTLHRKHVKKRVDRLFEMKKILTPEQFKMLNAKMKDHRKQMLQKFKGRKGKRGKHFRGRR